MEILARVELLVFGHSAFLADQLLNAKDAGLGQNEAPFHVIVAVCSGNFFYGPFDDVSNLRVGVVLHPEEFLDHLFADLTVFTRRSAVHYKDLAHDLELELFLTLGKRLLLWVNLQPLQVLQLSLRLPIGLNSHDHFLLNYFCSNLLFHRLIN